MLLVQTPSIELTNRRNPSVQYRPIYIKTVDARDWVMFREPKPIQDPLQGTNPETGLGELFFHNLNGKEHKNNPAEYRNTEWYRFVQMCEKYLTRRTVNQSNVAFGEMFVVGEGKVNERFNSAEAAALHIERELGGNPTFVVVYQE